MAVTLVVRSHASPRTAAPVSGAPLSEAAAAPSRDPWSITFDQPRIVLGRGAHADVRLPSRAVSDTHAIVKLDAGELSVTDVGSTNGTRVNGVLVPAGRKKSLALGDTVTVPGFDIVLTAASGIADARERTATIARKILFDAMAASGTEPTPPSITVLTGPTKGRVFYFAPAPSSLIAGRVESCAIVLQDLDCSRAHADFVRDHAGVTVRDLESKNGLYFSGRKITERRLRDGDVIELGQSALRFEDPTEALLRSFEGGQDEPAPVSGPAAPAPAASLATPDAPVPGVGEGAPSEGPGGPTVGSPHAAVLFASSSATGASADIAAAPVPGDDKRPTLPSRPRRSGADWIVAVLAVIILGVSAAALYFLVRTTPVTSR